MMRILIILLSSLAFANLHAACEDNVDKVQIFYINGMFTTSSAFESNKDAIQRFQNQYLSDFQSYSDVEGSYNFDESKFEQILEVTRQKIEDISNNNTNTFSLVIRKILNGDFKSISDLRKQFVIEYFADTAMFFVDSITEESDYLTAKAELSNLLQECPRVVLVTHSQGNFYGNALFNEMLARFTYPSGYRLSEYPMLGYMQIASPTNTPGGAAASIYPDLVGHITNDTDIAMFGVRQVIGSVPANYNSPVNENDFTGHGLESSYLAPTGQATNIAGQIDGIIRKMRPYPLHPQANTSSSALAGIGHSSISSALDIQFQSGAVYRYSGVPEAIFFGLLGAASQGGYFNEHVRNVYATEKLLD
ncbi:KTSC domain-containing protein [Microbulbifer magnicolonia]|uniref:KTSC domain-containing protein n=1 Tax=Microbulbifer magnicolonia TaxID=3109744 RepID=UPI002B406CBF|nr:KTSC domain-containing protein [Microbulbifer sp. GG15]